MGKENSAEVPFHCNITVIQASGDEGKSFTFDSKNWCVLGSHPDCDIRIKHSSSAPLHALVFVREDGVHLQGIHPDEPVLHKRSAKSLIKEEEMPLQPGDVFFLGDRGFRVEFEKPLQSSSKSPLQLNSQSVDTHFRTGCDEDTQRKARRESQSARKKKPKRRVSLVVEKNGERFVAQKGDTEKLLSKSQLARLSGGEGFHTPAKKADEETGSSTSTLLTESEATTSTDKNNDITDLGSLLPAGPDVKSLENKKLSLPSSQRTEDKQTNNASSSRSNTKAEPIASERTGMVCPKPRAPKSTTFEKMTKSASKRSSMSARDRKEIVYARLSQGLSAIPRRSEAIDGTTTVGFCTPGLGFNEHEVGNDPFGQRLNADVSGISRSPIRSPLVDKSPLLNIQQSPKLRGSITKECRTPSLTKKTPSSVLRSSKSTTRAKNRSVVFAARIELERGTHYSPFRPKQYPRTPVPKQELANLSRVTSQKFSLGSSGRQPKPMTSLEIPKVFEADESNANDRSPPGCRDDSPVTENLEMKPHTDTIADHTALSEAKKPSKQQQESSTSRLTGAITSFIKRLSGTLDDESDEGDSGSIDEQSSDILNSGSTACTDAVMTPTEIAHFTQSKRMSTTRRLSFLDKVLGAATAVRQVTGGIDRSESSASNIDKTQCESSSTVACSENHGEDDLVAGIDVDHRVSTAERSDSETPTSPHSPLDDAHSSEEEHITYEMLPKDSPLGKTEGHNAIFQRLAHGIEDRSLEYSESFEQHSDHSDETESVGFSSDDIDSTYSQDTADTFERDLEIAVTQSSAPSPYTPGTASVQSNQGLAGGKESVSETVNATHEAEEEVEATVPDQQEDAGSSEEKNENVPGGNAHRPLNEEKSMNATSLEQDHSRDRPPMQSASEVEIDCSDERKTRKSGRLNPANVDQFLPDDSHMASPPNHGPEQHKISEDDFRNVDVGGRIALQASLNKLRVVELRDRLRDQNLSAAGKKVELVNRLVAHLLLTSSSSEDPAEIDESSAVDLGQVDGEEGRNANEKQEASVTEGVPDNQEVDPEPIAAEPSDGEPEDDSTVLEEDSNGEQIRKDEDVPKGGKDVNIDAYRRKTVKELRNILRENNLDIMSKLRKEELIHHMISLNVRLEDEEPLEAAQTPRSERVRRSTRVTQHTPAASRAPNKSKPLTAKAVSKLTVSELRVRLANLALCQLGTKKILVERLMSGLVSPDIDLTKDNSVCDSCRAGQECEGGTTQTK